MFAYLRNQHELDTKLLNKICLSKNKTDWVELVKPQLHCHDFGHDGATTHPDLSSRDASA